MFRSVQLCGVEICDECCQEVGWLVVCVRGRRRMDERLFVLLLCVQGQKQSDGVKSSQRKSRKTDRWCVKKDERNGMNEWML